MAVVELPGLYVDNVASIFAVTNRNTPVGTSAIAWHSEASRPTVAVSTKRCCSMNGSGGVGAPAPGVSTS